jgi:hypothetical protein
MAFRIASAHIAPLGVDMLFHECRESNALVRRVSIRRFFMKSLFREAVREREIKGAFSGHKKSTHRRGF